MYRVRQENSLQEIEKRAALGSTSQCSHCCPLIHFLWVILLPNPVQRYLNKMDLIPSQKSEFGFDFLGFDPILTGTTSSPFPCVAFIIFTKNTAIQQDILMISPQITRDSFALLGYPDTVQEVFCPLSKLQAHHDNTN